MAALVGLSGCGDGGGSGSSAPPPVTVTLSGAVTFDFVPAVAGRGLDYSATAVRPARGVTVELLSGGSSVATTTTDALGGYTFSVTSNTDVSLQVRAQMLRVGTPSWEFRVVDNVNANALYALAGSAFNTGAADSTRNLHAASAGPGRPIRMRARRRRSRFSTWSTTPCSSC